MNASRQRTLGGGGHHVLDYLKRMQAENPAFFYAVQNDNDHSGGNIFWADATCRTNYSYFGDTVTFDTRYRTNRYRVPFASFAGLNHHGQPVLFGCALILNEPETSFIWLFQTWLHAMSGCQPVSITTDPDRLIQIAVAQVLPETRHRFCKWGIFRETQEKLAQIYQSHPTFETEFQKCINEPETIDEFESSWQSLLERYYVMDNDWLQSMYNARQQWVPVYMRDTFFGEFSITDRSGGHSFFDGYVNASTTIQMLIKQYEKALASWHEKEFKADYDTTNCTPFLKTPSPMEKQAANLYTRRVFMKFQEELVETLANSATKIDDAGAVTTYHVAKFGEDHKARTVSFNSIEMKASCSCQMFEYSGIICRHVLAVFRAKNVLTLPSQYILKRWTRNAKTGPAADELASDMPNSDRESLTVRYNNLRQEAIKYVEEGAKSIHVYNVAMDALREAAKKVTAAKNQGSGGTDSSTFINGGSQDSRAAEGPQAPIHQSVENLIKQAFVDSPQPTCQEYQDMVQNRKLNPEESHANRHLACQDQYIGVKKQHLGGDILIEDLKRLLYLQEGLYRKVEEEACELLSVNIYLDVFSKTLQKTLLEASGEIRLMKERMDELSHQLELSTESNELLMQRLQTAMNDIHFLNEYKASCIAKCNDMALQNQILESNLQDVTCENRHLTQKLSEWESLMMDFKSFESKYEAIAAEKTELANLLEKESLENGNLRRETSLLQKELETVKTDFDELASVNKNLQRTINNLQNKMHDMLSSYGESFSELCLHNKSADQNLESNDLTSVIMQLEVLQRNACQKIRQLMQEKKALIDEKDRAQMSFSKSESDIVLVKQKFEHDLRNMIDKQSVSNALLQKLQLRFEAVADKLKVSSEVEENNAQRHTDLFSDLDYLEVELQQLSSKNRDLVQEILALQVVTEEFDRSKQTISELTEENRALMVALQDKSEESVKLALEVDSFKQSFQSLHDELLVERSLRDDLKSAVSDITSQLSAKHSQLLDFDQQKSELIQKTAVLTEENQDLMVSLQNKSEEAAKLAVELDSVRNSLQSVHDELHGERSLSDELKSRAIDISSQLNEKQQQLIDFDQQNSEMIQKIAELTAENQALMVSLQEYAEESSRLASEGNTSKESLQSLRDELQSERSFRDELNNVVTDLTSQLNEKHCQLLDLDQQKSELVQLKLLVLDLESEKSRASEESSSVTSLQSELSEMHELLLAVDVRLIFTRTQYEAWVEELVQQVYSTDRLLTVLHTKNVDVETVLNSCLAREAQCNEENARLLTSLDTLRSELDSAIAENRVLFHENNSLIAQSEEYKSRAETMADNYGEHKSQLALEVERMKQLLVGSEEEIDDLMMSREELEIKVVVLKAKLAEQHAQVISSEGYIDEQKMLQNQCNELRRKLSEQILKTEEFRNLSIHLKELKDKADAECLKLHEKRESEGLPTGMQESLRIAFIKEQCETKVQELKHHLSISKKHSEEMLWKLQDAIDEIENRKKSEAAHLKKNEELGVKILELEAELQSLISDKREKTKAYDLAKAELECSLMTLECCKEEKEKLEVSVHECNEEKSKLYSDLSLMKKLLYSSTFPCRKEGNDGLHKESCISNELTGRNVQKTTNADTKSHGRMSADDTGNGPTGDVDEYLEHENMTNGIDAQNLCLGLSDEGSYSCTLMKEHPEQDVLQSSCLNGSSSLALVNQENTKSNDTKDLAIINDQFRVQSLKSSMDLLNEELERMKNENSLSRGDHNFDPKFSSLQRELMELDKVNEELGNIYPLFNERPGSGNAIERVLALEIELAEALQAKKKSSMHFQSSFLKQHNDEEAIFQSFRDINELIKDMLEIKGRYATVETELRDMHDRYSQLSLQFAEVEGERQKLMMTLKNVRASKRGIPLFLSSSASLGDSKSPVTNSQ